MSNPKRPWIVLVGPTAVGKTKVAEQIARDLKTDILIADSRQVYRGMNIGTNKPTAAEQKQIRRHLINLVPPDHPFSAGAYKKEAEAVIARLEEKKKPILIEGGTGLYIKALLYGLWEGPPRNPELRKTLLAQGGNTHDSFVDFMRVDPEDQARLHQMLVDLDPIAAQRIHVRDTSKILRALEVFYSTGRTLSSFHREHQSQKSPGISFLMIGLRRERSDLYARVEARVDQQIQDGLVLETKKLMQKGFSPVLPSMRALGYRQIIPCIQQERTLEETVPILKRDTRHYAKRQMTWFSADPNIEWIDLPAGESPEETFCRIRQLTRYQTLVSTF